VESVLFADVRVDERELSTGARIGLPVRYYDWSAIMAHFPTPAGALRRLLPTDRLRPAELLPGTGVLTMAAMEYRRIADVGAYNEFAIMVPVLYEPTVAIPGLPLLFPDRFQSFGLYVHHLPVTTQEAYDFGVELWGYPKFVAEIGFEDTPRTRRCRLRAEGKSVVTLEVAASATRARPMDLFSYTVKDGRLLRTRIQAQGQMSIVRFRGGATCDLGDHPIAEELRTLGMGRTAIERLYAPRIESLLHPASVRLAL
jgi:hypothetical protein